MLQIARHLGCEVCVATRGEQHRQLAAEMGAVWVGENIADIPVKTEAARAGVRPHDVGYPMSSANQALQDLKSDRINGTGVLIMAK
ncbi:MAG: hypothetical protein ACKV0T_17780 [Planctomycetales bacterium]